MTRPLVALDLFAGTGWGVACRILGIEEYGVELMPEAVATRAANGMRTIYNDVWEGLERPALLSDVMRDARRTALERIDAGVETIYDMLIASPPCQTFSMAGKGAGREALDEVVALIDAKAYLDVKALRAFGEAHDMRTALVITPLSHIARDVPTYVVLEQVPTVLPVWERMAEELRGWGYSVVTGVLNAEQYGVPQTRKRAILIARADGVEAAMPTPTHSAYYPRDPKRFDPGVEPWVPMATALGWGMTERPQYTVTSGGAATGGYEPFPTHAREAIEKEREAGRWLESNYTSNGERSHAREGSKTARGVRADVEPASTLTSKTGSMRWVRHNAGAHTRPRGEDGRQIVRDDEGGDYYQRFPTEGPAPTLTSAVGAWAFDDAEPDPDRPGRFDKSRNDSTRVTVAEASALQSYPATFDWAPVIPVLRSGVDTGRTAPMSKTKAFLQIGNAVPPLLALRVLETITKGLQ